MTTFDDDDAIQRRESGATNLGFAAVVIRERGFLLNVRPFVPLLVDNNTHTLFCQCCVCVLVCVMEVTLIREKTPQPTPLRCFIIIND